MKRGLNLYLIGGIALVLVASLVGYVMVNQTVGQTPQKVLILVLADPVEAPKGEYYGPYVQANALTKGGAAVEVTIAYVGVGVFAARKGTLASLPVATTVQNETGISAQNMEELARGLAARGVKFLAGRGGAIRLGLAQGPEDTSWALDFIEIVGMPEITQLFLEVDQVITHG